MIVYPAIDLIGGRCVRLVQGDYDRMLTYDGDPVAVAQRFREQGAEWLHIVDLDGAREGRPVHLELVGQIIAATGLPARLGGGLRSVDAIAAAFAVGVQRVAVGTAAMDEALLAELVARWGDKIEVALDRRGESVAVDGWRSEAAISAKTWAQRATALGVRRFLVTDITRDGTFAGANAELVAETREAAGRDVEITVAGGVTAPEDIRALATCGAAGAVVGRALYDGRADLPTLLAAAKGA